MPRRTKTATLKPKPNPGVGISELFERCVVRRPHDGWYEIRCRIGLWAVTGPTAESTEDHAMNYWIQYYRDGEYSKHLSNAPHEPRGEKT